MKPALALCFFVSGATSLVLEVAWAKELSYLLGNTLYAVSTVVAAFMVGLAFGSWIASRFLRNLRHSLRSYALLQCAIALCGWFEIPVLRGAAGIFELLYGEFADQPYAFLTARFAVVIAMMSIPVTLMGMTLPVVVGDVPSGTRPLRLGEWRALRGQYPRRRDGNRLGGIRADPSSRSGGDLCMGWAR